MFKNIDKIKSVSDSFVSKKDKKKIKPVTLIAAEENDYEDLLGVEKLDEKNIKVRRKNVLKLAKKGQYKN